MAEHPLENSPQGAREKRIGNYLIEKTLGKGTFGKVKLATHIPTGEKVAIKILQKHKIIDVADVERVSRQIHILKLIRHPNIIQLYEIIESPKHLFLVMEYMERGELFTYIVQKRTMEEEEACKVFEQIISGIEHTHKLRIVHRDLKLENLLMDHDGTIRIVDFGLSNTYKPEERLRTACGSPCYAAPQMIEAKEPYEPLMVDIWSAGVILYAMVCGCLPFEHKDTSKLYKKILSGEYVLSSGISKQLSDFLRAILTVDPNKRIRIPQMKQHPWWKRHSNQYYPEGLIVGYHKIPIDRRVLQELKSLDYDVEKAEKSLEANRHDNLTTTYYLKLKKFLREGGCSKADFGGKTFDKDAIQPNERKQKISFKPVDLIKMVTSPMDKRQPYYLGANRGGADAQKSFGQNSMRMEKKRRSQSKSKSKSKMPRNKSNPKNQTFTYDVKHNSKSKTKDVNKSLKKSLTFLRRSPAKNETTAVEQEVHRQRSLTQKGKIAAKKSHQASYMIGIDSGADWPLEPKWKGQGGGKIRNALRRR